MIYTGNKAPQVNNSSLSSTGVASDNGAIPQHTSILETGGSATKPPSYAEMFLQDAQILVEKDLSTVKEEVDDIEEDLNTLWRVLTTLEEEVRTLSKATPKAKRRADSDLFAIYGYASLYNVHLNIKEYCRARQEANDIYKAMGENADEIYDPRVGEANLYPKWVLDKVFNRNATS